MAAGSEVGLVRSELLRLAFQADASELDELESAGFIHYVPNQPSFSLNPAICQPLERKNANANASEQPHSQSPSPLSSQPVATSEPAAATANESSLPSPPPSDPVEPAISRGWSQL